MCPSQSTATSDPSPQPRQGTRPAMSADSVWLLRSALRLPPRARVGPKTRREPGAFGRVGRQHVADVHDDPDLDDAQKHDRQQPRDQDELDNGGTALAAVPPAAVPSVTCPDQGETLLIAVRKT